MTTRTTEHGTFTVTRTYPLPPHACSQPGPARKRRAAGSVYREHQGTSWTFAWAAPKSIEAVPLVGPCTATRPSTGTSSKASASSTTK